MPEIDRDAVREIVESRSAQLVEVLPHEQYEWAHLPGAVSLPLKRFSDKAALASLDRSRPVIVYCNDFL